MSLSSSPASQTQKLHIKRHTYRTFALEQVDLNAKVPICGAFAKPSDGLEPSTPSLPWRFWGGIGGHGRAFAITFLLQIVPSWRAYRARACPGVPRLLYLSRTRAMLSVIRTDNN
jgi:hypothetical protein